MPVRHQAIILINAGFMLIGRLERYSGEIMIKIQQFFIEEITSDLTSRLPVFQVGWKRFCYMKSNSSIINHVRVKV